MSLPSEEAPKLLFDPEGDTRQEGAAILVVSCDRYSDLWEPFFTTFFKYWPDCPYPIYLGTNEIAFRHPRIKLLQVGRDLNYSDNLQRMLGMVRERHVIVWVEDRLVSGPVQTQQLQRLIQIGISRDAHYLKLIPEHPLGYGANDAPIAEVPPGTKYRISITVGLWKKATLLSLLEPGETAWMLEKRGSRRSDKIQTGFFALAPSWKATPPIPHVHVIVKGRIIRSALSFLRKEGIAALATRRPLQTLSSVLYTHAYHLFFGVIRPAQARLLGARPFAHQSRGV